MMSMDEFRNLLQRPVTEENNEVEPLVPLKLMGGDRAKEYISKIYKDGAEQVLDEILRDAPQEGGPSDRPDEKLNNEVQVSDKIIFWSKSGIEPFVGVYQIGHEGMNTELQSRNEEDNMEDRIKNVDREAVENASYFILKGFDEGTVKRVIDDACNKSFDTEEALKLVRDSIKKDPRLASYALDEEEEEIYSSYRHSLRKKFLGSNEDVINPKMYEIGPSTATPGMLGGSRPAVSLVDPSFDQTVDPQSQTKVAQLKVEIAKKEAEHAKEMEKLNKELANLTGDKSSLEEKTDPNKGSQIAGFRHQGGPQALSNSISQMEWSGPGSQFDMFLNEITVDGYNMLGTAASGKSPEAQDPVAQPDPSSPAPAAAPTQQKTAVTTPPKSGGMDLGAL